MRKTFLYFLGGQLATISIPVIAQESAPDAIPEEVGGGPLTPDQMAAFESWPPGRQAQYEAWPTDAQAYIWTLTPVRQDTFWMLKDEDKIAIVAMDDATREEAWGVIERRLDMTPADPMPDTEPVEPAQDPEPDGR
ncbi:MAG: hypothetical protein HKO08_03040 [Erythrobacter sp.]|nr:hypothetical protein [Erythrobacter sp.]